MGGVGVGLDCSGFKYNSAPDWVGLGLAMSLAKHEVMIFSVKFPGKLWVILGNVTIGIFELCEKSYNG